jgi:hypothetical protein
MSQILFSEKEIQYLQNQDFLLTKLKIIEKLSLELAELREILQNKILASGFNFPAEMDVKFGKISRGEKYQNLPYLVLDFPKLFKKQDIFSFRTMFWWGNEFSFTLHLQGIYQFEYQNFISSKYSVLADNQVFIGLNDTPWEYDFQAANYQLIAEMSEKDFQNICASHPFLKLSRKLALDEYQKLKEWVIEGFEILLSTLIK